MGGIGVVPRTWGPHTTERLLLGGVTVTVSTRENPQALGKRRSPRHTPSEKEISPWPRAHHGHAEMPGALRRPRENQGQRASGRACDCWGLLPSCLPRSDHPSASVPGAHRKPEALVLGPRLTPLIHSQETGVSTALGKPMGQGPQAPFLPGQ